MKITFFKANNRIVPEPVNTVFGVKNFYFKNMNDGHGFSGELHDGTTFSGASKECVFIEVEEEGR